MTPEGRVKAHLKKRVVETGGRIRYLRWLGRRSALDTLIWWPHGPLAFVEVKKDDGRYQPGQEREIERLRADGLEAHTVRNVSEVDELVDKLRPPVSCSN